MAGNRYGAKLCPYAAGAQYMVPTVLAYTRSWFNLPRGELQPVRFLALPQRIGMRRAMTPQSLDGAINWLPLPVPN